MKVIQNTLLFSDCGNLTDPADGSVSFSSGTTYQSVATFNCDTGYTLEGEETRTCQANETWSNIGPSCRINGKHHRRLWVSGSACLVVLI